MEKNYKKILEEELSDLDSEIGRQAKERAQEKGTLTSRVYQYASDRGIVDTGIKVGVATGVAYVAGFFVPIIGPVLGPATLLLYGGKKLIYDPFIKKKK